MHWQLARVFNYRISFLIVLQFLISYHFPIKSVLNSGKIQWLSRAFITFRRKRMFPRRYISTLWARSTRSRKVHFFSIPSLTVRARARFICRVDRERGRTSATFLPLKQRILSSHEATPGTWPSKWRDSILSLSPSPNRECLAFSPPRLRFSFARPSTLRSTRCARIPSSSKGDDVARIRDTQKQPSGPSSTSLGLEFQRIENLRAARREKHVILPLLPPPIPIPCFSVLRNGRLSWAFRYREVRKGCEETGLSLPRTLVTFATFDIISSSTRSRTETLQMVRKSPRFDLVRVDRGLRVDQRYRVSFVCVTESMRIAFPRISSERGSTLRAYLALIVNEWK